jgi:hypothetical protein
LLTASVQLVSLLLDKRHKEMKDRRYREREGGRKRERDRDRDRDRHTHSLVAVVK